MCAYLCGEKTKPTHSHETSVYQCINPAQPVQWLLCLTPEPEVQKPLFNFVLQLVSVEVWIISSLCLVWAAQWEPAQGRSCCCFIGSAWGREKSEDGPDWANPTSPSPKAPKPTGKIYLLPHSRLHWWGVFLLFVRFPSCRSPTCTTSNQTLTLRNALGVLQNKDCSLLPYLISSRCTSTDRITRVCLTLDVCFSVIECYPA